MDQESSASDSWMIERRLGLESVNRVCNGPRFFTDLTLSRSMLLQIVNKESVHMGSSHALSLQRISCCLIRIARFADLFVCDANISQFCKALGYSTLCLFSDI